MEERKAEETEEKSGKRDGRRIAGSAAREICYTAMFVAIITVCAWISIPMPSNISITLQTMGVCLAGGFLGWKRGLIATAVYILLGLFGVPVFAGFTSGAAKLGSVTGGYIVGFLFTAPVAGLASDLIKAKNPWLRGVLLGAFMALGILLCYAFGTAWFVYLYNSGAEKSITLYGALSLCVIPYLLPDLVKVIVAAALVVRLKKYMRIRRRTED